MIGHEAYGIPAESACGERRHSKTGIANDSLEEPVFPVGRRGAVSHRSKLPAIDWSASVFGRMRIPKRRLVAGERNQRFFANAGDTTVGRISALNGSPIVP